MYYDIYLSIASYIATSSLICRYINVSFFITAGLIRIIIITLLAIMAEQTQLKDNLMGKTKVFRSRLP